MAPRSGFLFLAIVSALGSSLLTFPIRAAQLSVVSFPEKLIVSAGDNRTIAFSVFKDGAKVPEARLQLSLVEGSGTLDASDCRTDDAGQCLISYDAPATLGKSRIEAVATTTEGETGTVSVDIDVVEVPTIPGSGWQCDSDRAVFTEIDSTTTCSEACGTAKDCSASRCLAGSDEYCHRVQEACACEVIITEQKYAAGGTQSTDIIADNPNIAAASLLLGLIIIFFLVSILIYMTADKKESKHTKKLAFIAMVNLGIAIIIFSMTLSRF